MRGNQTLRYFRHRLGLSQRALADKTGLNRVYISQLENGQYKLGHNAALAIVDAFPKKMKEEKLTVEDFLRDSLRSRRRRR